MTEIAKLIACFASIPVVYHRFPGSELSPRPPNLTAAFREILGSDFWKMAVPAVLYTIQNNLLFVALANLEATLFQVLYQSKVLTTALLMVLLLGRRLTWWKWGSLFLLFLGIVLTQLKGTNVSRSSTHQNAFKGLLAVLTCAISSAFASVYFEKVLKSASVSIAVKNIQLSGFSIVLAMFVYWFLEKRTLDSFFNGYDSAVWVLVLTQAAGGLIVALVIKYADNILKGFATALAIVLGGVVSFFLLDFSPTLPFLFGAILVVASVGLYGLPER
jgi:UDP-sugar transporter A1/2/3